MKGNFKVKIIFIFTFSTWYKGDKVGQVLFAGSEVHHPFPIFTQLL